MIFDEFDARCAGRFSAKHAAAKRFPMKQADADRIPADGTYAYDDIVKICVFEMMDSSIVHNVFPPG
jgi:hypothetical protein